MLSLLDAPKLIVGAGGAAWWVLQGFRRESVRVDGFLVTTIPNEYETCGLPIFSPSNWNSLPEKRNEYVVILGIMNPSINLNAIESQLKDEGFNNILSYSRFLALLYEESGINCCMLDSKIIHSRVPLLEEVKDMFCDALSRDTFDHFLTYTNRFTDNEDLMQPNPYFPDDLPRWPNPMRIIDCGAFDGDTVLIASQKGYEIESAVCLEPDSANFEMLKAATKMSQNHMNLPLAVGARSGPIFFSEQSTTGSHVVEKSNKEVTCIAIDEVFSAWKPNFLKMDIEGSELQALIGASLTIKRHQPAMAISIYHTSSDIIEIPLLIKSLMGSRAKFYLRRHSRTIADTVLYVTTS